MILQGENLTMVSFPLGGLGSGCIGLSGNGRLIDWEIFHQKPNKNSANGYSHFAVRAEKKGKVIDARILNGDYTGNAVGEFVRERGCSGFGWGPRASNLTGMPHFKNAVFKGEFPIASIDFFDDSFPGRVTLNAWSVFIPGDSKNSSLPAACFEIRIENSTSETLDYSTYGALANPWSSKFHTAFQRIQQRGNVTMLHSSSGLDRSEFDCGDLTLSTDSSDVSWQEYWYRGGWFDALEIYWYDMMTPGRFKNRTYPPTQSPDGKRYQDIGGIASHFTLAPGASKSVRYLISWNSPHSRNDWTENIDEVIANQGGKLKNDWTPYYATLWNDSRESASAFWDSFDMLRASTFAFHDALFSSTLPQAALDGISANISILKSPTVLRLEDGTFYGWEGVGPDSGSCEGSCQHVWNYAQALSLLFPDLERSMRLSHFNYNFKDEIGSMRLRLQLPLGLKAKPDGSHSAADGVFGEALKAYREWKISGDPEWLKTIWPSVKKILNFTWSPENPDLWDPSRTGVLWGRQHHTLDMELFGPNAWLTGHYLAALKAASEMARSMGEFAFADECLAIFEKGRKWVDENLFNGEYYIQKLDLHDRSFLKKFAHTAPDGKWDDPAVEYWDSEHGEIKYQIGSGCEIDMHLPQWYASLYGLGDIFDKNHVRSTLNAVYKHNFVPNMRSIANAWRSFAINDEGGTLICTWPDEASPAIPLPYHKECMTGFEWAAAAHLIQLGEVEKGENMIRAIRARYDGHSRNPWNEIECGSNYARAMASFALLQAYSGFCYDMTIGMIGFAPVISGDFRCFWSLGRVWGMYERRDSAESIRILCGKMELKKLKLKDASSLEFQGETVVCRKEHGILNLATPLILQAGNVITVSEEKAVEAYF